MEGKRIILTGATGMAGGSALKLCLANSVVSRVTVIGRKHTGIADDRLREVITDDFSNYSNVAGEFEAQDVALYCLGAYTGSVPDDLFRQITVDYTVAFAQALHKASPRAAFCFLSGQGADPTEQSRMAFARYKGAAENPILENRDIRFMQVKNEI
jgi:nucleoside-diphosphate-sugar epimerase